MRRVQAACTTAGIVVLGCLGGCSSTPSERLYEGDNVVAIHSVDDALTWADTVAIVTVTGDRVLPGGESVAYVGRNATLRIDEVIWSRPGTLQPPPTFECEVDGWYRSGAATGVPVRDRHGVRIEVGRTYVAPIVYLFHQWAVLPTAAFQVVDGTVQLGDGQATGLAKALDGKSASDVAPMLVASQNNLRTSQDLQLTTAEQLEAIGVRAG